MKPVTTAETNATFQLEGGTRDNDLPLERTTDSDGRSVLRSRWKPTLEEVDAIQNGALVYLIVWGSGTPPVAIGVEGVEPS